MDRVAFSIFGMDIMWYGVLIGLGIIVAVTYGSYAMKKTDLTQDDFLNMLLIALPSAIVGARAYYVIFNWSEYSGDIMSVFAVRNGGLAIYGGIIAAALSIIIYCRVKKINPGIPFDLLAVGLPMAQAIGRWGNFVNAEAFGGPTTLPWGMVIGNSDTMVHPTFLYESLWNVLSVVFVLLVKKHKKFEGELFCVYMIWYGIGRFWIEGLRADSLYAGSMRVSQLVSVFMVIIGLSVIFYKRIYKKNYE
ncbi:MAG: prolipoprotein diacylglyceryl transferase [Ruminococcaceae bacterium]|nr:prolipoprotein diacylglyceryl transferase [Oscillospiraceae bacterium]